MPQTVPIEEFARLYCEVYQYLYDTYDRMEGYREAVHIGDRLIRAHHPLAERLIAYREGDIMSSDREVASFALAVYGLNFAKYLPESESVSQFELLSRIVSAKRLWAILGDVLVDDDDRILADFRLGDTVYPAGTDRIEVWHGFEEILGVSVAFLMGYDVFPIVKVSL